MLSRWGVAHGGARKSLQRVRPIGPTLNGWGTGLGWRGGGWRLCASFELPPPCPPCPFVFRVFPRSITFALSSPAGCGIKKPSKVRWSTGIARFSHALWLCLWMSFCPCLCALVHLPPFAESMSSAYLRLWDGWGLVHVGCHLYSPPSFMPPPLIMCCSRCLAPVPSSASWSSSVWWPTWEVACCTSASQKVRLCPLFRFSNSAVVACVYPVLL
jgi:hypothetical protein